MLETSGTGATLREPACATGKNVMIDFADHSTETT
jgi:hypothetical protein